MAIELVDFDIADPTTKREQASMASVLALLERLTLTAEAGSITAIMTVTRDTDGTWSMNSSDYVELAEAIGQLEMMKLNLVFSSSAEDCDCDEE